MELFPRSRRRPAVCRGRLGAAAPPRPGRSANGLPDVPSPAKSATATKTDASSRCAGSEARTSMRGWSCRGGGCVPEILEGLRNGGSIREVNAPRGVEGGVLDAFALAPRRAASGCDSSAHRIKGNISRSGTRIYHVPGGQSYAKTRIDTSKRERWFCTEVDAGAVGGRRVVNDNWICGGALLHRQMSPKFSRRRAPARPVRRAPPKPLEVFRDVQAEVERAEIEMRNRLRVSNDNRLSLFSEDEIVAMQQNAAG